MAKHTHYADVNIMVRVYFTDDGDTELADQAHDAVVDKAGIWFGDDLEDFGREIVGSVEKIDHGRAVPDHGSGPTIVHPEGYTS